MKRGNWNDHEHMKLVMRMRHLLLNVLLVFGISSGKLINSHE